MPNQRSNEGESKQQGTQKPETTTPASDDMSPLIFFFFHEMTMILTLLIFPSVLEAHHADYNKSARPFANSCEIHNRADLSQISTILKLIDQI